MTDVEGRWEKLEAFATSNPHVTLDREGHLHVADDAIFVFGGDAIDRGVYGRRIIATLLEAKERQPDRVVLLAGNRDINKLRLRRELAGHPPRRAPIEIASASRGELLRWIFPNTMGAREAFAMRASEIAAGAHAPSDDDVAESFLADVAPDGAIPSYLARCQLAFRADETLFVHGAVTDESLGVVPGATSTRDRVDDWIFALNDWYRTQIDGFRNARPGDDASTYEAIVAYQAPIPGTRNNQASVVYGRLSDATNNPHLPSPAVVDHLRANGIERLVVGHTPCGDAPAILRARGFELVCADNSYGRLEHGSQIFVNGRALRVVGRARLDDGSDAETCAELGLDEDPTPLGARDRSSGHLVVSRLVRGGFLLFKGLDGFAVEQRAESDDATRSRSFAAPHRPPFFPES